MSRTHKDRPYWVKVNDKKIPRREFHDHHRFGWEIHSFRGNEYTIRDYCTIDELREGQRDWELPCYHELSWTLSPYDKVSRDMLRSAYYGPLRNDEHMALRKAVKEYNSSGEINEDIVLREKTRHSDYSGSYWN